jgi:hypothetical protein
MAQSKRLAFAAAALLIVGTSSAAMAQDATAGAPGNTEAGTYSGPTQSSSWPVYGNLQYGQYGVSAGTGSQGRAFVGAGTQANSVGATTQAPGTACSAVPGTDVDYDCDTW